MFPFYLKLFFGCNLKNSFKFAQNNKVYGTEIITEQQCITVTRMASRKLASCFEKIIIANDFHIHKKKTIEDEI